MTWTPSILLDALAEERWGGARFLFLRELRAGTGYDSQQSIDGFLLDAYPSSGMYRSAFEVKVSRADFLRELKKPMKRRLALRYSNRFYFVAPVGLIKPGEVPIECGLIEVRVRPEPEMDYWKRKYEVVYTVHAPHRDVPGPTWTFMAAALRCQMKGRVEEIGGAA